MAFRYGSVWRICLDCSPFQIIANAIPSEAWLEISSHDSRSEGIELQYASGIATDGRRYKLAAMKLVTPSRQHLEKHYEDLSDKPFFKGLVECATSHLWSSKPSR